MDKDTLYFDDLQVGERFSSGTYRLSTDEIRRFAADYDPQPFHLDEEAARSTLFGGLAASGWHTAAITMRLLVTSGPRLANGIVGAGGEIEWKAPSRPGDVLRVESEVAELIPSKSRPDRGILILKTRTLNQRGEVVQTFTARLMLARRR